MGDHGIGKSEILRQAADEVVIRFIRWYLYLIEPPDLVGLPKLDGNVTRYCQPSFLPTDGAGLLVFEELSRCPTYMRAPCLQLLTARCLNDYLQPPDWLSCGAINPPGEDYEVAELAAEWPDFLIDLATLELTFNEVFDGPGAEGERLLDAERLGAIPAERFQEARLVGVSCLRLLPLRYPVHRYFTAVRRHEDPVPPEAAETYLAVTR